MLPFGINIYMQKKFEGHIREKIEEPSNLKDEDANGKHGNEARTPNLSLVDDTTLFYKAINGSKIRKSALFWLRGCGYDYYTKYFIPSTTNTIIVTNY